MLALQDFRTKIYRTKYTSTIIVCQAKSLAAKQNGGQVRPREKEVVGRRGFGAGRWGE
jgi:hypothetical protein